MEIIQNRPQASIGQLPREVGGLSGEASRTAKKTNSTVNTFLAKIVDFFRALFCCASPRREVVDLTHSPEPANVAERVGIKTVSDPITVAVVEAPKPFKPEYSGKEINIRSDITAILGNDKGRLQGIKNNYLASPRASVEGFYVDKSKMPATIVAFKAKLENQVKAAAEKLSSYRVYKGDTPTFEEAKSAIETGVKPSTMSNGAWKALEKRNTFKTARENYSKNNSELESLYLSHAKELLRGELATLDKVQGLMRVDHLGKQEMPRLIFNGQILEKEEQTSVVQKIRNWAGREEVALEANDPTIQAQAFLVLTSSKELILDDTEQRELADNKQALVVDKNNAQIVTFDKEARTIASTQRVVRMEGQEVKATYAWIMTFNPETCTVARKAVEISQKEKV